MYVVSIVRSYNSKLQTLLQVRTSYLPNEILWGHRFEHESMRYAKNEGHYTILHNSMNKTLVDKTPRKSAKVVEEEGGRDGEARNYNS